jgi:hypothetical protein
LVYDGIGGGANRAGLAVRKFEDVTDLGANAVMAVYAGLEEVAPFV